MPSVTIIDPTVLADTFSRLGLSGLDALAARGTFVFDSIELRGELKGALSGSTALVKIEGWLDDLRNSQRTVSPSSDITANDRLLYDPTLKSGPNGEKFDISARKYIAETNTSSRSPQ